MSRPKKNLDLISMIKKLEEMDKNLKKKQNSKNILKFIFFFNNKRNYI